MHCDDVDVWGGGMVGGRYKREGYMYRYVLSHSVVANSLQPHGQ